MPDLNINATPLPGEAVIAALLNFATAHRATMSQENRDAFDKLHIAMLRGWHNFWVSIGWPGEKV
jgi:hypothetical protein